MRIASTSKLMFPSVRRLFDLYNIKESDMPSGSGPRGILLKGDVLKFINSKGLKPVDKTIHVESIEVAKASKTKRTASSTTASTPSEFTDIDTGNMRKVIAARLTESKQNVPHEYITQSIRVDKVVSLRKKLIDSGTKVSVNDFIILASALSLKAVPEANVTWNSKTASIDILDNIDVSVAVAIEGGLITPIIKDTPSKGLTQISNEMKELAKKAKEKTLLPHEFQGGTFSISNLGMFGINNFIAVINPPQSMILAIGGILEKTVVDENRQLKNVSEMNVSLSYDSRAIDPLIASQWLSKFKTLLENPVNFFV